MSTISKIEKTGLCHSNSMFEIFRALGMHMIVEVEDNQP